MKCKQKDLKKQGKWNFPKRAEALTDDEVDEMYEKELLGSSTPSSMLNTLWYQNTLHFGIRGGGEEHRRLQWHDIQLKHDITMKLDSNTMRDKQKPEQGTTFEIFGKVNPEHMRCRKTDQDVPLSFIKHTEKKGQMTIVNQMTLSTWLL